MNRYHAKCWVEYKARNIWDWWTLDLPDWKERTIRHGVNRINRLIDRAVLWWFDQPE